MQTLSAHNHFTPLFNSNLCYQGHLDLSCEFIPSVNRSKSYDTFENVQNLTLLEGHKTRSDSSKEVKSIVQAQNHIEKAVKKIEQKDKEEQVIIKNVSEIPVSIHIDENSPEREFFMRCMVIGAENTGKHTLINSSFQEKTKEIAYKKTSSDFLVKTASKFKTTKKYHFWVKTLGNTTKTKENIWKTYYKSANAFVFVYDITNKKSFEALNKEIQNILEVVPQEKFYGIIIGTKSDCKGKREVNIQDAIEFQHKYKLSHFIETDLMKEEQASQMLLGLDSRLKLTFEAF